VGRRIGKWMGRNTAAEKVFQVEVIVEADKAVGLQEPESSMKWQYFST